MKKILLVLIIVVIGLFILIDKNDEKKEPELSSPEELQRISDSISDFSFNLFSFLADQDENIFISPYSIHTALGLAYIGADEETQAEIAKVLSIDDFELREVKKDFLLLKHYLEYISKETEVNIANALFLRDGVHFLETFKSDARNYFEAEIKSLPEFGREINEWVSEKTNQKIEEIIDSGPIAGDVISYLVNAIYFRGIWEQEFDPNKTSQRRFYGTERRMVDMMENTDNYRFLVEDDLVATTLEYKDGKYLFHIIMPDDLEQFYNQFDYQEFSRIKNQMTEREIVLKMPKFKLEYDVNLNDTLQFLGIEEAFDPDEANFSRMINRERSDFNAYIGNVLHSSFIEVDERGTEAAAVTAVEMRQTSLPTPVEFNYPFLFVIENADTKTILFIGQVVDIN